MDKHSNRSVVRKIERRLGARERTKGVNFVKNGYPYEFAEIKQGIRNSINQLNRSRVLGTKKLLVPEQLCKYAKNVRGQDLVLKTLLDR